ncbi:MAG: hypothetical protein IJU62_03585 [Muribaculaceae bacterium]|nr:hypothetical protein [Muribaculaceae bacterium]
MDCKIERDGVEITVWAEGAAVGVRFTEGETMQRYLCGIVMPSLDEMHAADFESIIGVSEAIVAWCAERWPHEFAELKT